MAGVRVRTLATIAAVALVVTGCGTHQAGPGDPARSDGTARSSSDGSSATGQPASPRALTPGEPAWVAVSVATLWREPSSPRPVDAPALANPARILQWLDDLTLSERRALNGRADTQALMGDRVRVVELRTHWARVVVPDQPTPLDTRGYPGWVPRRQLTADPPAASGQRATVVARTPWLRTDDDGATALTRVSFGTRLPYLGTGGGFVRVGTPDGIRRIAATAVAVHDTGTPGVPATRKGLARSARQFVGLDYLWAGRSGFGFDCSGLTSLVHRVHGLVIPRDAGPQSEGGRAVAPADRRRGDLLFYATGGVVHHVSMYVGDGMMVHSPGTGQTVEVISVSTPAYRSEYAGARRYLGAG